MSTVTTSLIATPAPAQPMKDDEMTTDVLADELAALIAKATDSDLSDGGRYFRETCTDLTRCNHGDTGEYVELADGKLVEWLWNHRATILAALSPVAPAGASDVREALARTMAESVDLDWTALPDDPDAACGYGMPEGCKSYWRRLAALAHPADRTDDALEAYKLPCDVLLPPSTIISAGCNLATLKMAMEKPERPQSFTTLKMNTAQAAAFAALREPTP